MVRAIRVRNIRRAAWVADLLGALKPAVAERVDPVNEADAQAPFARRGPEASLLAVALHA